MEGPSDKAQRESKEINKLITNKPKKEEPTLTRFEDGIQEEKRFTGTPIGALVEHGSAALKLNVHELTGDEEQFDQQDLMIQWDLDVHGK